MLTSLSPRAKRRFYTCLAAPYRCLNRLGGRAAVAALARGSEFFSGLRKRGTSLAQEVPPRTQPVRVWRTGFCPGERSPEVLFYWTGEAPIQQQHGAIHQSLQILLIGFAFVKIKTLRAYIFVVKIFLIDTFASL